eukprot:10835177-Prorocentrum_lima.AAC.1
MASSASCRSVRSIFRPVRTQPDVPSQATTLRARTARRVSAEVRPFLCKFSVRCRAKDALTRKVQAAV